jgi:hypothetical protein
MQRRSFGETSTILCQDCQFWERRYGDHVPYGRCQILTASLRRDLPESLINFDCEGQFGCVLGERKEELEVGSALQGTFDFVRDELVDLKRQLEDRSQEK